jgi:hypothetical protein
MAVIEPIDRLESAIEKAESIPDQTIPVSSTLCEVFRIAKRGFTDDEATYWADRLERLMVETPA